MMKDALFSILIGALVALSVMLTLMAAYPDKHGLITGLAGISIGTAIFLFILRFISKNKKQPKIVQIEEVNGKLHALRSDNTIWKVGGDHLVDEYSWEEIKKQPPLN